MLDVIEIDLLIIIAVGTLSEDDPEIAATPLLRDKLMLVCREDHRFAKRKSVRWAELDPNGHMRHSAYADFAADLRVNWLASLGYTVPKFAELRLGPILFREETKFMKELHGGETIRVKVNGVDVFDPNTGEIRSDGTSGVAAWFIDTDYNEESFFVRHAYFLGANDPYKSLKTALKAEIDEEAWATLYSDTSRPFERPSHRKIAVKVINHFGDEVMKVFGV